MTNPALSIMLSAVLVLGCSASGGKLGVAMVDYPLDDNVAGPDGRNPAWCLTPL